MIENKHFQCFVDTGGTFTDCIGVDEKGKEYRRKVLSSSSLRGTITKYLSSKSFEISDSWNVSRDIFQGFSFRILKTDCSPVKVDHLDIDSKTVVCRRLPDAIEPIG
jgi:5-oxoprolinase (ATP-hydrolysing)